jgi:hypothetical protein
MRQQAKTASSRPASSPQSAGVTGILLTKLDGTAKGGIAVAIARELNLPVRFVGVGEKMTDLLEFSPAEFVDSLLEYRFRVSKSKINKHLLLVILSGVCRTLLRSRHKIPRNHAANRAIFTRRLRKALPDRNWPAT